MNIDIDSNKEYAAGYVGRIGNRTLNISGCTVGGTIKTSAKYAAGFVAATSGVCNITDCLSDLTIDSSVEGVGAHGGFVGVLNRLSNNGSITIKGCVFSGSFLGDKTNGCGGFVGSRVTNRLVTISDSVFDPASVTADDVGSAVFCLPSCSNVENSYYFYPLGSESGKQGKQGFTGTAGNNTTVGISSTSANYKTSRINSLGAGIQYKGAIYAGEDDIISLTLGNIPPERMMLSSYTADKGTLTGDGNPYTLEMPADSVVVNANFADKPDIVGDVNLDWNITILDVTTIQMFLVEAASFDNDQLALANTNGDDTIDVIDATLLQLYLADYNVKLAEKTPPTILSTTPGPTLEPPTEPPAMKTIKLVDNVNWGTAYLYAWDSNGDPLCGDPPGTLITETEMTEFNEKLFIIHVPNGACGIYISNANGERTEEINNFDVDGYYFLEEMDEAGNYKLDWYEEE